MKRLAAGWPGRLRLRGSGNPEGVRPLPGRKGRERSSLSPLSSRSPRSSRLGDFLRVPPPLQPSTSGTPGAGRREEGAAGASEPRLGNVVKEGSPGEGPGGEDLARGGTPEVARGAGACFRGSGSPPGSQPPAKPPPPTPAGVPATTTGQPHSPYLARLLSLLRGRHLFEA